MPSETTAPFGAWCALKSLFPSDKDIRVLRKNPSSDPAPLLRELSLPENASSVFLIEGLLLERYAGAIRSVSRFASPDSAGVFEFLQEEFDWWNVMLLAKNSISRRDRELIAELLFKPPVSTMMPPDISSTEEKTDVDIIMSDYQCFFPAYARNTITTALLNSDGYRFFEYFVSAMKLIRLSAASSRLDPLSRSGFSLHIKSGYKSIASALPSSIPSYLSTALTALKNTIPPAIRSDTGTSLHPDEFDSPFARFVDLVETRTRITGFCAALGWMKHHVVS